MIFSVIDPIYYCCIPPLRTWIITYPFFKLQILTLLISSLSPYILLSSFYLFEHHQIMLFSPQQIFWKEFSYLHLLFPSVYLLFKPFACGLTPVLELKLHADPSVVCSPWCLSRSSDLLELTKYLPPKQNTLSYFSSRF